MAQFKGGKYILGGKAEVGSLCRSLHHVHPLLVDHMALGQDLWNSPEQQPGIKLGLFLRPDTVLTKVGDVANQKN